jgi:hypothetical protein
MALKQKFIKQLGMKLRLGVLGIYQSPTWNIEKFTGVATCPYTQKFGVVHLTHKHNFC